MIFNVNLMNLSCCHVSINQSVNRHSFLHCITRVCKNRLPRQISGSTGILCGVTFRGRPFLSERLLRSRFICGHAHNSLPHLTHPCHFQASLILRRETRSIGGQVSFFPSTLALPLFTLVMSHSLRGTQTEMTGDESAPCKSVLQMFLGATTTKFSHYYLRFTNSRREQCLKNSTVSHKALKIVLNTYQTPIKWRDVGSFGFNSMAFCKVQYNILSNLK